MSKGILLAAGVGAATLALVVYGTVSPIPTAVYYAGGNAHGLHAPSTPESAIQSLGAEIRLRDWGKAYDSLANKAEFTEPEFEHDLTGYFLSLRTGAALGDVEVQPLHESANDAEMLMKLHWTTVLGPFENTRDVHVVKNGDTWQVDWPLVKEQHVPPQVIPVNYLRWDVIYSGAGDEWGTQNVAGPNIKIVDMHPVNRAEGVFVMGELLNQDVVPAWVSVDATLVGKNGAILGTAGSFDMIMHTLLPKQVTPFIIRFPNVELSQVASIRMDPHSTLVSASADPVIEVQNEKYTPGVNASLAGQVSNQSGQVVNFAHVLSTFYNQNGQLVWVAGRYIDRALLPQTPVDFNVSVPVDLAKQITSEHSVVSAYSVGSSVL